MENIEAMLCAYIEGDLDEAGRAQIEQHLKDNPQHQKLIEELMATRDLVRKLPRAKVSADMDESLRGQMERSMLLTDVAPAVVAAGRRGNRWPQMMAVAAVFLLCASLGLIVWRMVMPNNRTPQFTQVTQNSVPPAPDIAATDAPVAAAPVQHEMDKLDTDATKKLADAQVNRATPAPASEPLAQFDVRQVRERLLESGFGVQKAAGGEGSPVVLVINSSDTSATADQVSKFLGGQNGVEWKNISNAATNQFAPATQLGDDRTVTFNGGVAANSTGSVQGTGAGGGGGGAGGADQTQFGMSSQATAGQQDLKSNNYTNYQSQNGQAQNAPAMLPLTPATQPSSQVYVAKGITRDQLEQLQIALAGQADGQSLHFNTTALDDLATTQPGGAVVSTLADQVHHEDTGAGVVNPATTGPSGDVNSAATTQPFVLSATGGLSILAGKNAPDIQSERIPITLGSGDTLIIIQPELPNPATLNYQSATQPTTEPATQP